MRRARRLYCRGGSLQRALDLRIAAGLEGGQHFYGAEPGSSTGEVVEETVSWEAAFYEIEYS